jgi:hypothetical protein
MHRGAAGRRQGIDVGELSAIELSCNAIDSREALPDYVGPEAVQQNRGPVVEWLRIHPIE